MIAAIGLAAGILLGLVLHPEVPLWLQPYLPIAIIAALDAPLDSLTLARDRPAP